MPAKKWTDEEREAVRRMARSGLTFKETATALGRTSQSVHQWAHRNGVKFGNDKRWTARELRRAAEMYKQGLKCRDVALKLGRSEGSVSARLHLEGVTQQSRAGWWRVHDHALRYSLGREGWSAAEVIAILDLKCTGRSLARLVKIYAIKCALPLVKWPRGGRPRFRIEAIAERRRQLGRLQAG
jgi:transposase